MSDTPPRAKRSHFVRIFFVILTISMVAGLAATSVYFYLKYRSATQNTADAEQAQVVSQVGALMALPEGTPQVATVTDKEKLTDQGFFRLAENGDKVLLYVEAQRAVLFRPSLNKIIDIAPITPTQTPEPQASSSTAMVKKTTLALYNGTPTVGITQKVADRLTNTLTDLTVSSRENATKLEYEKTMIIDLTGKNSKVAQQIATEIGGEVTTQLPEGEKKSSTDILIIIGSEYQ